MGSRWGWWTACACLALAIALAVAHLVHDPDRIDPDDYREWRAYCMAEADRNEVRGTRAWVTYTNDCMVDVATADAELQR